MMDTVAHGGTDARTVFERPAGEVELHDRHPVEAAVVRIEVPVAGMPEAMGAAFGEVAAAMAEAGDALGPQPFARYLAWGPDRIVAEVGFPVERPAPAVGRVYPAHLPGGVAASIVHVGPYDTLTETYDRLRAWFAETGRTPADTMWEVYWSEPVGDPSTWRTEILWPVA